MSRLPSLFGSLNEPNNQLIRLTGRIASNQAVAKVSKATATRHLTDMLYKACLTRLPGGGRSTRYRINPQDTSSA